MLEAHGFFQMTSYLVVLSPYLPVFPVRLVPASLKHSRRQLIKGSGGVGVVLKALIVNEVIV